jgi:hypothetical protein
MERTVTFRVRSISAREALTRMFNMRGLVLVEDPVTTVALITRINQTMHTVDASLLDTDTNSSAYYANFDIPLIQFEDVPLDIALENIIRQSSLHVVLDPRISAAGDPPVHVPTLSLRWEKVSAKQAIIALCENFDLDIIKDATTGVIQIKPKPEADDK